MEEAVDNGQDARKTSTSLSLVRVLNQSCESVTFLCPIRARAPPPLHVFRNGSRHHPSRFCIETTTGAVVHAATSSVLRRPCHVPCVTWDPPNQARKPAPRPPSHTPRCAPGCAVRTMHFANGTSFFSKLHVLTRILVYKIMVLS